MRKIIFTVIITLIVLGVLSAAFIFSGIYDVAASKPEYPVVAWVLSTTMERSVRMHAESINVPPGYEDISVNEGFVSYQKFCQACHGAPGVQSSDVGKGLNPRPPDLKKTLDEWNNEEVFWVVKNGIRMTGMPSFGKTHEDAEIWPVVAFAKKLKEISEAKYRDRGKKAGRGQKPARGK
jgi:mono/diheme cytochrome c family protein